jgi:hypothetical protein
LREIYALEDYKQLKLTKTELENYAMLVMKLGLSPDGEWQMDLDKAKEFWKNLDGVLPEEIGSILSPMPVEKISFERGAGAAGDGVAEAENRLFSEAGVSSLLFNNTKASSSALALSIKADQAITFGIVRGIEAAANRFLQSKPYGIRAGLVGERRRKRPRRGALKRIPMRRRSFVETAGSVPKNQGKRRDGRKHGNPNPRSQARGRRAIYFRV